MKRAGFTAPPARAARAGRRRAQRGQSSTEYVVVCAALVVALGIGLIDDTSVLHQLFTAFHEAYQNFSFAISLPE